MKKFLSLIMCLMLSVSIFSACNTNSTDTPTNGGNNSGEQVVPDDDNNGDTSGDDETVDTPSEFLPDQVLPENIPNSNYSPEDVVTSINDACTKIRFGINTYQMALTDVSVESVCNAFIEKGYTALNAPTVKGQKNETKVLVAGNNFVTLHAKNNNVRVMWDICDTSTYPLLFPNNKTNTGAITMAQIGVDRGETPDNPSIGMCYVYKLSDGRAVIVDGGLSSNDDEIFNTLKKLDISKNAQGKYLIATWILTHGHADHYGALSTFAINYKNYSDVSFIMHSFPMVDSAYALNDLNVESFFAEINSHYPNSIHVVPHKGLRYFIGNLTIDMLYTPDMLDLFNYYNDTSLIFMAKCAGKKVLHFGDATEKAATETWFNYDRQTFTADVLQITHHGLYTGPNTHNWSNIGKIYTATGATYGLLPMGTHYQPDTRNGRWTLLCDWAKKGRHTSFIINNLESDTNCVVSEQADWDKFVLDVNAGSSPYQTCLGYNGKNIVVNRFGLTTYIMSTETENMATVFNFTNQKITIAINETLSNWFN